MTVQGIIDELIPLRKSRRMTIGFCLFANFETTGRQGSIRSIALVGSLASVVVGWFRHGRVSRTTAVRRRQYGEGYLWKPIQRPPIQRALCQRAPCQRAQRCKKTGNCVGKANRH